VRRRQGSLKMSGDTLEVSGRALAGVLEGSCPRCFWLTYHCDIPYQMPFPGIFSVIDSHTKHLVHGHFDKYGRLPDWYPRIGRVRDYVKDSRRLHWSRYRTMDRETGIVLTGSPDDIFILRDGSHHIVDYKTARITQAQDELYEVYEVQLNAYAYIAERVGYSPVSGLSLIYMEPEPAATVLPRADTALGFRAASRSIRLQPGRVIPPLLREARQVLARSTPPRGLAGCGDCEALRRLVRIVR
jgi:hypothetical protein